MAIGRSGPLAQVSGRVGGVEFALNGGRQIIRKAKGKRSRVSERTYVARGIQAAGIKEWESFTDAQRLAWEVVARDKPVPDRFGIARVRTGRELFLTIPHDHRFGVPANWQVEPPSKFIVLSADPAIVSLTTTVFSVQFQAAGPASQWVASAWYARFTKSYKRQHRNWFKGGLVGFNKFTSDADFTSSMAALDVVFLSGEQVAIMVEFWHKDYWPLWWDFGVQTIP
jgi:hypothetical protein